MITVELLGPPRGKGRPRFSRKMGIAYTPENTRTYEAALRHEAALAMNGTPLLEGALAVNLVALMPIPQSWSKRKQELAVTNHIQPTGRPDLDNLMKMLDSLNGVVWRDDSQVVNCLMWKAYDRRPRLVVTVRKVEQSNG